MNPQQLDHFRQRLLAEKDTMLTTLRHQAEEIHDVSGEVLDPLTTSETKLLEKIELALLSIESKTYGICTACDQEIPISRLEAKPSVSLCCDCQKEHESTA